MYSYYFDIGHLKEFAKVLIKLNLLQTHSDEQILIQYCRAAIYDYRSSRS
jgi:hypothetical protein